MGCVGSLFPVAIFKLAATAMHIELYAIQRQFNHDQAKNYKHFKQQEEKTRRKKDNKKAS